VALLTLLVAGAPSLAAGGKGGGSSSATATASASVSGSTANLTSTVSRASSAVSSVSCVAAGRDAGCRLSTSSRRGSTYTATMTGLAAGSYTFTATYHLTDGTSASASASFTVGSGSAPTDAQARCAQLAGAFSTSGSTWQCSYPAANGSGTPDSTLMSMCSGVSVWTGSTSKKGGSTVDYSCTE
jgi:hypothetical protein